MFTGEGETAEKRGENPTNGSGSKGQNGQEK